MQSTKIAKNYIIVKKCKFRCKKEQFFILTGFIKIASVVLKGKNMIQPIDDSFMRPIYNAVDINIRKPEVNASGKKDDTSISMDNGIYNAVKINVDRPAVNTEPKKTIYDYPLYDGIINYNMLPSKVELPAEMSAVYYSNTEVIPAKEENKDADQITVPEPNYTTLEAEKENISGTEEKKTENLENNTDVSFHGAEGNNAIKKPEIIPGEEIKPDVNIAQVVANLKNADYDKQAIQIEEIARLSLEDKNNAMNYIVKDVFLSLMDIANNDTSKLEPPTKEQIDIRKKLITDFMEIEKNPQAKDVPFKLSEDEVALAAKLSPMEQAERNKEYALYTMAILDKVYIEEIKKETNNVVPMTDVPGLSTIVDAVKNNPNLGVKVAAIDALNYIQRPEYKEELNTIYTLAQQDKNQQVVISARRAQEALNKN